MQRALKVYGFFFNILSINTLEWDKKWESAAFRVSHPSSGFPSFFEDCIQNVLYFSLLQPHCKGKTFK